MRSIRIPALALALAATVLTRSAPGAEDPGAGPLPLRLVVLDLTGDGLPEKLYLGEDAARVELNLGDGQYQPVAQELPGVRVHDVLATDLDGDGVLDAYLVGPGANHVWLGLGGGRFRDTANELGLDDAGFGLSAERLDVDGDGLQDLLLHNASGDVLFHARRVGARLAWNRDPDTPEIDAGQRLGTGLVGLALSLLGGALDPGDLPENVEVHVGLDDRGRPALRLSGRAAGTAASTEAAAAAPTLTGTPAPAPVMMVSPDAKYVNDNAGEVDSADVIDGSLTGADISTTSGNVGVGTTSPDEQLHVVGPAVFGGTGHLAISGNGVLATSAGDAELRLARDRDAVSGMSFFYDGTTSGAGEELRLRATANGGSSYTGNYLTVERDSGEVGIGTSSPEADLHVVGSDDVGTVMIAPSEASGSEDHFSQLRLVEDSDGTFGMHIMYHGDSNKLKVWGTDDGNVTAYGPHLVIERDSGQVEVGDVPDTVLQATFGVKVGADFESIMRGYNDANETVFRVDEAGRVEVGDMTDVENHATLMVKIADGYESIIRGYNAANETVFRVLDTGRVVCSAVEITGGGDLVEPFETDAGCEPGTVLVIDHQHPGRLISSTTAYDRRVAGVVSGAGGVNPGLMLSQDGVLEGNSLVALTGRVYVKCSAENGAIAPGDLLTTASLVGHAMKSDDADRSHGAVIGKAMSALDEGTGLVLVLVNLQ